MNHFLKEFRYFLLLIPFGLFLGACLDGEDFPAPPEDPLVNAVIVIPGGTQVQTELILPAGTILAPRDIASRKLGGIISPSGSGRITENTPASEPFTITLEEELVVPAKSIFEGPAGIMSGTYIPRTTTFPKEAYIEIESVTIPKGTVYNKSTVLPPNTLISDYIDGAQNEITTFDDGRSVTNVAFSANSVLTDDIILTPEVEFETNFVLPAGTMVGDQGLDIPVASNVIALTGGAINSEGIPTDLVVTGPAILLGVEKKFALEFTLPAGSEFIGGLFDVSGNSIFAPGFVLTEDRILLPGETLGNGVYIPSTTSLTLPNDLTSGGLILGEGSQIRSNFHYSQPIILSQGAVIPSGTGFSTEISIPEGGRIDVGYMDINGNYITGPINGPIGLPLGAHLFGNLYLDAGLIPSGSMQFPPYTVFEGTLDELNYFEQAGAIIPVGADIEESFQLPGTSVLLGSNQPLSSFWIFPSGSEIQHGIVNSLGEYAFDPQDSITGTIEPIGEGFSIPGALTLEASSSMEVPEGILSNTILLPQSYVLTSEIEFPRGTYFPHGAEDEVGAIVFPLTDPLVASINPITMNPGARLELVTALAGPQITSLTSLSPNQVEIVFDKDYDPASIDNGDLAGQFSISPFIDIISILPSGNSQTIILETSPQIDGVVYTLSLTGITEPIQNVEFNPSIPGPGCCTFVGIGPDPTVCPDVIGTLVEAIDRNTVRVYFDKNMDSTTTLIPQNFKITNGANILPVVAAVFGPNESQVDLSTTSQSAVNYTLVVSNAEDTSGNIICNNTNTFLGSTDADDTDPFLIDVIALDEYNIFVQFSEPMDLSFTENISSYSLPGFIFSNAVSIDVNQNKYLLNLDPSTPLGSANYTLAVSSFVTDLNNNQMTNPRVWNFPGIPDNDTNAPEVSFIQPIDQNTIVVVFDAEMEASTALNIANYTFSPGLTVSNAQFNGGNRAKVELTVSQQGNFLYTLTVNPNVRDSNGNNIAAPDNTGTFTGNAPPTILSVTSIDSTHVEVIFSEAVDTASAEVEANYNFAPGLGIVLATKTDTDTVLLQTAEQSAVNYTLTIDNVEDLTGNTMGNPNADTFLGDVRPFLTNNVQAINNTTVEVRFNENVTGADNPANYSITGPALNVTGATIISSNPTVVHLTTDSQIDDNYTVSITNAIEDVTPNTANTGITRNFDGDFLPALTNAWAIDYRRIRATFNENIDCTAGSPALDLANYTFNPAAQSKKGYSGVAVYTKVKPKSVEKGFGIEKFDIEGRNLIIEYEDFTLFNTYYPNGGQGEHRIQYKLEFYEAILEKWESLRKEGRELVLGGDYNTAHHPIDLARPKENENNTGFLPRERAWLDKLVEMGYVDSFRAFSQEAEQYTYWDMKTRARDRNVGWRIDYFWVTEGLMPKVKDAGIHQEIMGSDHCPLSLELSL